MPMMARFPTVFAAIAGAGMVALLGMESPKAQAPGDWQGMVDRINNLQDQIYRLREAPGGGGVTQLQGSVSQGDPASEAGLALRIDNVEGQLRNLTGQIDQLSFQIQQLSERFNRFSEDVEFRFRDLGSNRGRSGNLNAPRSSNRVAKVEQPSSSLDGGVTYSNESQLPDTALQGSESDGSDLGKAPGPRILGTIPGSGSQSSSLVPEPVTSQPLSGSDAPRGPDALYQDSHEKLLRRQFSAAEAGFKKFLRSYPKSKLAGNAQYWLGESYYARRQYNRAAKAFLTGYKRYPKGRKAPDNLVKLGMTLARLGQKKQACATLAEAQKRFPRASAVRQVAKKERSRAGC